MREAYLYYTKNGGTVKCGMCPHACQLSPGERGECGVRENIGGKLYSAVFGRAVACNADPIEKKPLYHFLPGSKSLSVAAAGCNLSCVFCQNHEISQGEGLAEAGFDLSPEEIVERAVSSGCKSISYTYTEPTVFMEYALETARLARSGKIKNVFVTNGYMTPGAFELIRPYLDAANIDLKSFSDEFYRRMCSGTLAPVINTIRNMIKSGIWVEITTLIIPGMNDSAGELAGIAEFISAAGADVPWHISRFHPARGLPDLPPTPAEKLEEAAAAGRKAGLRFVYIGNLHGDGYSDTRCPGCGREIICRDGYTVSNYNVENSNCRFCGFKISGVFNGSQ